MTRVKARLRERRWQKLCLADPKCRFGSPLVWAARDTSRPERVLDMADELVG